MPGFESNRFIDLSESLTNHLICSICLNIFDNAVRSECEHTFCKSCVQQWIETNHKECPECRTMFSVRKRSNNTRVDNNLVIIRKYIFKRNLLINGLINEMKIKCDFDFNGYQESVKLSQLSAHIRECEHRLCKRCDFLFGKTEEHNCFELSKNNRNEWKELYEKQLEINNKLKEENSENKTKLQTNEKTINELKQKYENSVKDINQLKDNFSILKTELQTKDDEIKKLNKYLSVKNNSFKEIKTIDKPKAEKRSSKVFYKEKDFKKVLQILKDIVKQSSDVPKDVSELDYKPYIQNNNQNLLYYFDIGRKIKSDKDRLGDKAFYELWQQQGQIKWGKDHLHNVESFYKLCVEFPRI